MTTACSRISVEQPLFPPARMVPRPRRSGATHHGAEGAVARTVVASSNTIIRYGVRCILDHCPLVSVAADVPTGPQACDAVVSTHPDLLVLDLGGHVGPGVDSLLRLTEMTRVVVLVSRPDPTLLGLAARYGVSRVLVHGEFTKEEFLRAVVAASRRQRPVLRAVPSMNTESVVPVQSDGTSVREQLSSRETEVMSFIARGLRNADIADALSLTEKTVKNHINRIFAKLQVVTRAQAIVLWLQAA